MLIMILNDGETFTDIDGCFIVDVPEGDVDATEEFLRSNEDFVARFEVTPDGAALYAKNSETIIATITP